MAPAPRMTMVMGSWQLTVDGYQLSLKCKVISIDLYKEHGYDSPMDIDVKQDIGNVTREVSTRDLRRQTCARGHCLAPLRHQPGRLWEAITSADRIPRWFMPITGDLKLGGRYQLHGNAGGQILICEPPRHLKVTWEYGGKMSWVEVRIAKDGTGST